MNTTSSYLPPEWTPCPPLSVLTGVHDVLLMLYEQKRDTSEHVFMSADTSKKHLRVLYREGVVGHDLQHPSI